MFLPSPICQHLTLIQHFILDHFSFLSEYQDQFQNIELARENIEENTIGKNHGENQHTFLKKQC